MRFKLKGRKKPRLSLKLTGLLFAGFFLGILFLLSYVATPKVAIVGFHGITDLNNPGLGAIQNVTAQRMSYPMQELEKFLEHLVRNNYWFLSAQEAHDFFIAKSKQIPAEHLNQKPVMITFDDSYKTVYENVFPILAKLEKQYGRKAKMVLFVNSGTLAKPDRPSSIYLSCQDLRTAYETGYYDIQSHGQNHKNMTRLNANDLVSELLQAQTQLRQCLLNLAPADEIAAHLAYPYGAMNDWVASVAAKYYHSAYLYNSQILRFCWLKDHYRVSRLTVNRDKPADRLIQMAEKAAPIRSEKSCS